MQVYTVIGAWILTVANNENPQHARREARRLLQRRMHTYRTQKENQRHLLERIKL